LEAFADPVSAEGCRYALLRASAIDGNSTYFYARRVPTSRPAAHYTVRALPWHPDAAPAELPVIFWQK
jgi:hypothetical protein